MKVTKAAVARLPSLVVGIAGLTCRNPLTASTARCSITDEDHMEHTLVSRIITKGPHFLRGLTWWLGFHSWETVNPKGLQSCRLHAHLREPIGK